MPRDNLIVRCSNCRAKNRIPQSRSGDRAVCGKCRTPLPYPTGFPEHPVNASDSTFEHEALGFSGPVAALFWAPWCGHCQRLLPLFDELASDFAGYIKFVKIELDKNPAMASKYQVQSVPTMLFLKNGGIVNRLLGALPKHELEHHLRSLLR